MGEEELQAFLAMADEITAMMIATPEIARQTLIDAGIHTEDGELAPEYQ